MANLVGDLKRFAMEARLGKRRCAVCKLAPELLAAVRESRAGEDDGERPSFPILSDWLEQKHKVEISPENIQRHFKVHER